MDLSQEVMGLINECPDKEEAMLRIIGAFNGYIEREADPLAAFCGAEAAVADLKEEKAA